MKKLVICLLIVMLILCGCTAVTENNGTNSSSTDVQNSQAISAAELVGTWERVWTEVEGDRNKTPAGVCRIVIENNSDGNFVISYTDNEFPESNYQSKPLNVVEGELYYNCGNPDWYAEVDYIGRFDTTFCLTVLNDGTLLLQNYFLIDGAPMVSYECFVRAD